MSDMNLHETLTQEIKRNEELLKLYEELPPAVSSFGAAMIKNDIEKGKSALESGEATEMLKILPALKNNK